MDLSFYASLGVPMSAVSNHSILKKIQQTSFTVRNKLKVIPAANQLKCYKSMLNEPRNGLCCIYSMSPIYQRVAAFHIFRKAIVRAFNKKTSMPYWHKLTNEFNDSVSRRELLQQPSLLVVDGVSDKTMPAKIELARDIITQYLSIPVILLVTTAKPAKFTESTLIMPNRFVFLEDMRSII